MSEIVRECRPEDEVRSCDCNFRQGTCHCSDNDCGWEPESVMCTCRKGARCLPCIDNDGLTKPKEA